MPICKECGNDEWFIGSCLAQLRALVKLNGDDSVVENGGSVVLQRFGPVDVEICAVCHSKKLDWPEVELPF